jgi:hypothetical protein
MVLKNKINGYNITLSKGLLIINIPGNGRLSEDFSNCLMLGKYLTQIKPNCLNFKAIELDLWEGAVMSEDFLKLYEEIKI